MQGAQVSLYKSVGMHDGQLYDKPIRPQCQDIRSNSGLDVVMEMVYMYIYICVYFSVL